MYYTVAGS